MKFSAKKITTTAMLAAIAYVIMVFVRIPLIPAAPFLEYDPKDVLFVIIGFLIGPVEALVSIILVCLLEMVTVSDSGPIGLLMNVIASVCFVLPAAFIYSKFKKLPGAIIGLIVGVICMTGSMVLWNYWITPIYMNTPREVVAGTLLPVFVPFNLIKATLNMALTLIIYKPISKVFHSIGISKKAAANAASGGETNASSGSSETTKDETAETNGTKKPAGKFSPFAIIIGVVLLAGCIAAILLMKH